MSLLDGTFSSLGIPEYRRLWTGSVLATTAFMMSFMLVPSVAFEITGSNAAAGLAQMGSGIAMFVVSPIGGVIADRMRKKPIVLAGQAIPASVILVTGLLILNDSITVPMLTAATLIMGLGFAFMGPARQAWVGELVPRDALPNAVALQSIAQNVAQVAAPMFIAVLVGTWLGIGGTYLFMASLFFIVLPLTSSLPNTPPAEKELRPLRAELLEGISYVLRDTRLRTLWLGFIGMVVCGFAFQTLLPGLLEEELGRPASAIGPIFLALAVAGLLMSMPLAGLVRTPWAWPMMLAMGWVMALGFVLVSVAPTYLLLVVAGLPLGIGRSGFMLLDNALLMSSAKRAYHGRVMSLAMMGFGSQALLAPLWGLLADAIGVRETLMVVGVSAAVVTTLIGLSWLRIRHLPPSAEVALGLERSRAASPGVDEKLVVAPLPGADSRS
ncbi:MAG: MFS transporter [Actinomycetota bacterium]|nr:MFS transporter [Actinomycetota bacterium]